MSTKLTGRRRLLAGAGLLGFGFGGLVDVVVFHFVLQHHHLLSGYVDPTTTAGFRRNIVYDGLFSLVLLAVMVVGFVVIWRVLNRARRPHSAPGILGAVVVGAGVFNFYDGTVDHYALDLHDVVHGTSAWNPHWIGVSLLLLGIGVILLYPDRSPSTGRH